MPIPQRLRMFAVRSTWAGDAAVAVALTIGGFVAVAGLRFRGPGILVALASVATTSSVAYRRLAPIAAFAVAVTSVTVYQRMTYDPLGAFVTAAVVLTAYTFGREATGSRRHPLGCVLALSCGAIAIASAPHGSVATVPVAWVPLVLAPTIVGLLVTRREQMTSRLAATQAQLEQEQALREAEAAAAERNRVARELHDVVAHSVSVMVIQAGAARLVARDDPAAARDALLVVETTGRDAMSDLRRVMGVLHRDDDLVEASAGLDGLDALVERVRAVGVATTVDVRLLRERLPAPVDLVAYRIVQEALTNVVKHAGRGATARVIVATDATAVVLEISNTAGDTVARDTAPTSGRGLQGMRERVAWFGGSFEANGTADGGYRVHAHVPLTLRAETPELDVLAATGSRDPGDRAPDWMHDERFDRLAALAWFVALEIEAATSAHRSGPLLWNMLAVGVMAVAAVWRRRAPLRFLVVVGLIAVLLGGGLTSAEHATLAGGYALVVPLYTIAAWAPRRRAIVGVGIWAVGASVSALLWSAPLGGLIGALVMGSTVVVSGRVVRSYRTLANASRAASERLVAERSERQRYAVANERGRLARDIHALVAYGVVSMVVQAEAARAQLTDHAQACTAIEMIECTGREALARLRDILGVLHTGNVLHRDLDGAVV
jgi:signal transduction histidine kinase